MSEFVRLEKADASMEEVFTAAKKARCHEFIEKLPEGYETMVGEGGATLSGGEKQRVSIARAILKDAPIILLDEATASLDPENELYIQEAIGELIKSRDLIVIAHRLSTITHASQILVLKEGEIVERGTHQELLAKEIGLYLSQSFLAKGIPQSGHFISVQGVPVICFTSFLHLRHMQSPPGPAPTSQPTPPELVARLSSGSFSFPHSWQRSSGSPLPRPMPFPLPCGPVPSRLGIKKISLLYLVSERKITVFGRELFTC